VTVETKRRGLLTDLDPELRRELTGRGRRRLYQKDETVFAEGDPGGSLFVIETGRVQVYKTSEGGQQVLLGQLGPGDVVGEMAMLDGSSRSASVVAAGPTTGSLVTFSDFEAFLVSHPKLLMGITIELARKLKAANALAESRAPDDGAARLARCLLDLAERWGGPAPDGGVELREVFPQGTLGRMAGLSRETVNRRLRDWQKKGLIATVERRLTLHSPEVLRRIAEPE
jgi:CRP/FNR family transcriptional regulator, cyclic AMP receptor protein